MISNVGRKVADCSVRDRATIAPSQHGMDLKGGLAVKTGGHVTGQRGYLDPLFNRNGNMAFWPAAGFVGTEIRCSTGLESWNATTEVQPRVQA